MKKKFADQVKVHKQIKMKVANRCAETATSTTGHVILTVTEKCQKDMDRLKKNHAQEIQRMKERYEELEKQNEECSKVFEGLKAIQEKKKMYDGIENGTMSSKIMNLICISIIIFSI